MKIKKYNRKLILITILCLLLALLSGCGSSLKFLAKRKAISAMQDKYGIKAKATKVMTEYTDGLLSAVATGRYLVKMKYDGKEFGVLTGPGTDYIVYDNYQADEIATDFAKEIEDCSGLEPYHYQLVFDTNTFDEFDRQYDNYFSSYYDGSNLYSVLTESYDGKINLIYLDCANVRDVDLTPIAEKFDRELKNNQKYHAIYISMYSFTDKDSYESNIDKVSTNQFCYYPYEFRKNIPDIYDGQFFCYKNRKNNTDKLTYSNPDKGYEYNIKDGTYRYFGDSKDKNN